VWFFITGTGTVVGNVPQVELSLVVTAVPAEDAVRLTFTAEAVRSRGGTEKRIGILCVLRS
jgi:hypothetical protein